MGATSSFASTILRSSAGAFAGMAASELLERQQGLEERFGPQALSAWKDQLQRRLTDLATAVGTGAPHLFATRVEWERLAFEARGRPAEDLVASVECLRDVLRQNLSDNAWEEVCPAFDEALKALDENAPARERALDPSQPNERLALLYLATVMEGHAPQGIDLLCSAVDSGLSVHDAYLEVLVPAQREMGRMWHLGEVSICEEHFVTSTTRLTMQVLLQMAPKAPPVGKTVLAAAVSGNTHDLGLQVVAHFFEMAGYRVIFVGADCPAIEIAMGTRHFDVDLLLLSATLSSSLLMVERTIQALRDHGSPRARVMVGGQAFSEVPHFWEKLGADAFGRSAHEAVREAHRLFGIVGDPFDWSE